jgi:hypothetical protein
MTPSPFHDVEPLRPTLLQRLLGRKPPANALVTLIRRLRAADSPRAVSPADMDAIGREHAVDLRRLFRPDLEGLYREYLVYCLTDSRLSTEELADLEHLRSLFGLDAGTVETVQRNVARQLYLGSVDEVLADGTVDPEEREFLRRLRTDLSIPEAVAENILEVKRRQREAREKRRRR